MNGIFSYFTNFLLIACLSFYGTMSVAGNGDAGFLMEICAEGATKTIRVDESGNAIDPSHTCTDCLMCSQGNNAMPGWAFGPTLTFTWLEVETQRAFPRLSFMSKRNIRPIPRGPPMIASSERIVTNKVMILFEMHSDGRPLFKDADA